MRLPTPHWAGPHVFRVIQGRGVELSCRLLYSACEMPYNRFTILGLKSSTVNGHWKNQEVICNMQNPHKRFHTTLSPEKLDILLVPLYSTSAFSVRSPLLQTTMYCQLVSRTRSSLNQVRSHSSIRAGIISNSTQITTSNECERETVFGLTHWNPPLYNLPTRATHAPAMSRALSLTGCRKQAPRLI
jgi:hypothetical protein